MRAHVEGCHFAGIARGSGDWWHPQSTMVHGALGDCQRGFAVSATHGGKGGLVLDLGDDAFECPREVGIAFEVRGGAAGVAVFSKRHGDGHGAEEGDAEALGHLLGAAATEDVVGLTVVTDEVAHVLHDAEDFDAELLEHACCSDGVILGDALWGADDDRAGKLEHLGHGEGDIPCSGGKVDDQVIEIAPFGLFGKLFESAVGHRAAPDEGAVGFDEFAERDGLDTVDEKRLEPSGVHHLFEGAESKEGREAGAIDIPVEDAHGEAAPGKSDGEIDGDGAFADAAFPCADRDDMADVA